MRMSDLNILQSNSNSNKQVFKRKERIRSCARKNSYLMNSKPPIADVEVDGAKKTTSTTPAIPLKKTLWELTSSTTIYSGFILLNNITTAATFNNISVENWLERIIFEPCNISVVYKNVISGKNNDKKLLLLYIAVCYSRNLTTYFNNSRDIKVSRLDGYVVDHALLWLTAEGSQCNETKCFPDEKCMLLENITLSCISCNTLDNSSFSSSSFSFNASHSNNDSYEYDAFYKCVPPYSGVGPDKRHALWALLAVPLAVLGGCCKKNQSFRRSVTRHNTFRKFGTRNTYKVTNRSPKKCKQPEEPPKEVPKDPTAPPPYQPETQLALVIPPNKAQEEEERRVMEEYELNHPNSTGRNKTNYGTNDDLMEQIRRVGGEIDKLKEMKY
ncbi:hypothetical protein HELRODRAFT_193627 [Helobdella robusta]|uniref:Uncharacterized protein n=1 Tax=Helobdella robusta TaxID=6412 RepID=T1FV74_HELRO|nr:hypothetical protein HELRODRAFT_193627 [Helobdella robusta]ESN95308.1 hypothetical protein HELRODRAFT_193627 [Helobdella robusta]